MPQPVPQVVQLNLIRDFEVCCDREPVVVAPASQRVVCFLAFQPRPVRRGFISGSLWFDTDERHASACLRSALWRLHPLGLVCASNTHLWLNPAVQVDLRQVVADALEVLRGDRDGDLAGIARELIEVGDDILSGWYEDWVIVERERFRQLRLHALDRIGEGLIEAGRWYDALQVGLAATSAEPLRESAHRLLVRVHLLQGNVAEAIRQYGLYADMLRRELGGRPSPAMRSLLAPFVGEGASVALAATRRH
jgi:DNA-binding SARP family transcriptional activator